jgi:uncharacterized membrane protein YqjE
VAWGARSYPLGYSVALFAPLFFLVAYFGVRAFGTKRTVIAWLPFTILALPFLWNFRPEFPHAGYLLGIVGYAFLAFLTAFLENTVSVPQSPRASAPKRAQIRRLEEAIKDWRAILFVSATTYIVVMIYWLQMLWQVVGLIVTDPREKFFLGNAMVGGVLLFSIFVVIGPIWTLFRALKNHQLRLFELEAEDSASTAVDA